MNRTVKLKLLHFRRLQRRSIAVPSPDETQHTCRHCGYEFKGRQCPMCGMPGGWTRFTWKRLMYGFLDIWGMGNRPMFRSMGHLMWRPGYMIRDYLGGHYLSYFPPFKMLAVMTVLVAFVIWLLNIDTSNGVVDAVEGKAETANFVILNAFLKMKDLLFGNALYRLLLEVVMLVLAVWIVFRKQGLNLVETFFAMVYISCQMQLLTAIWLLLTRIFITSTIFPYAMPEPLVLLVLILDFRQLYGLRLWAATWRGLLVCAVLLVLYIVAIFAFAVIAFGGMLVEQWLK